MDIEALVSKYFGWCPRILSAAPFKVKKTQNHLRHVHAILAMAFIFIVTTLGGSYLYARTHQVNTYFTYLDDVTISIDDESILSTEVLLPVWGSHTVLGCASKAYRLRAFAGGKSVHHSPPYGIAMMCSDPEDASSLVVVNRGVRKEWNELNVTWFVQFPSKGLKGDEAVQKFYIYTSDSKESRPLSYVSASIEIVNGAPQISIGIKYYGEIPSSPPDYCDEETVDFSLDEWHKITYLIDKPQFIVLLDDEPVIEAPISPDHLGDCVDFRWRSFYS